MRKEIVSIEWHDLSVGQLLYVQAVVMPEIVALVNKHIESIEEIGESEV